MTPTETPELYTTLAKESGDPYETVRLRRTQSTGQQWCFISHSDLGNYCLIASYPMPNKVLMATRDGFTDSGYGDTKRTRVLTLSSPIIQGGQLPPEVNAKECHFYTKKVGANYYIWSRSGIFDGNNRETILQVATRQLASPPKEGQYITVHYLEKMPHEQFSYDTPPTMM